VEGSASVLYRHSSHVGYVERFVRK